MSNNADSNDRLQLELFEAHVPGASGISPAIARAQVSPGWWPLLVPLFGNEDLRVTQCAERDGQLVLDVGSAGDEGSSFAGEWAVMLKQRVQRTCGACGLRAARPRILDDQTVRVLCETCEPHVSDAISFAARAGAFWRFDGERLPAAAPAASSGRHPATIQAAPPALPPNELRELVRRVADHMAQELRGQDEARILLALLGTLHVTGNLPRGPRVLIVGRTGTGKSTSVVAMRNGLEAEGFKLPPLVFVDATRLSSPGWHGMNLPDAAQQAVRDHPEASKVIVLIDELDKIGIRPDDVLTGNMAKKREEVLFSLLGALGGSDLLGEGGVVWDSRPAFIIGIGAFTGALDVGRPSDARSLVRAGLPLEIATRFETVIRLDTLDERVVRDIVERSPAVHSASVMCERLGFPLVLTPEALAHAARMHALSGGSETPRSAIGWVVTAIRAELLRRLAIGTDDTAPLVITPDSLTIPPRVARPGSERDRQPDPGNDEGDGLLPL